MAEETLVQPVGYQSPTDAGVQSADFQEVPATNSVLPAYCPPGKCDGSMVKPAYCPPGACTGAVAPASFRTIMEEPTPTAVPIAIGGPGLSSSVMTEEPAPSPLGRGPTTPGRRSYSDLTADSCFSHAEDYSWLQGQVEFSRICKGWRLRFASVDESDRYGGSVTLTGDGDLRNLKDGQFVRVKGHLVNQNDRNIAPAYRVDGFEVIDKSK